MTLRSHLLAEQDADGNGCSVVDLGFGDRETVVLPGLLVVTLDAEGDDRDVDVTAASLDRFAPGDGDAWRRLAEEWERVGDQNPYCMAVIPPKLAKLRKGFAARIEE